MQYLSVPTIDGDINETIYTVEDFPYRNLQFIETCRNSKTSYYNVSSTFDIESTTQFMLNEKREVVWQRAFMYHWQFCIDNKVVFGRTWEEFVLFLDNLRLYMDLQKGKRLAVYVHNLPYEFQFMKDFIKIDSMFAKDKHKPLKVLSDGIEFRCSYSLSNMSLIKFCENSELCKHFKLVDDYDYSLIRTPLTTLTPSDQAYCYNDVRGLCECIDTFLQNDTIASMPLTNTGFVRREYREAMKTKENRNLFLKTRLYGDEYKMCKDAFRGGNTHANRFMANQIIDSVYSFDLQSSYPACMMLDFYPVGKFTRVTLNSQKKLNEYLEKYCVILDVEFYDIEINEHEPVPYIAIDHCQEKSNVVNDNGRVLKADFLRTTLTNIDLDIIRETYHYDGFIVVKAMYATRGKLPYELRKKLLEFYEIKTQLKDIDGKEYEYMKSKNRVNSSYGMMVTDLLHSEILFNDDVWSEEVPDIDTALDNFYRSRNNFLSYQWGIFVTANARKRLQDMLYVVGSDVVYVDTDSIKFVNEAHIAEFEALNNRLIIECEENDIPAYAERDGVKFYLGIWDKDGVYKRFKTLGAKKYVVEKIDKKTGKLKFEITVAGMNKKKGATQMKCIENFNIGTEYWNINHNTSWYNDEQPHSINVDGCEFTTASNIAIVETVYKLGISDEYWDIINYNIAS